MIILDVDIEAPIAVLVPGTTPISVGTPSTTSLGWTEMYTGSITIKQQLAQLHLI
jgi:hypothetical protein